MPRNVPPSANGELASLTYIPDLECHCLYICFLYVNENVRRQGLAKHLLHALAEIAFQWRCRKIYLENVLEPENQLYQKVGFRFTQDHDPEMVVNAYDLRKKTDYRPNVRITHEQTGKYWLLRVFRDLQ